MPSSFSGIILLLHGKSYTVTVAPFAQSPYWFAKSNSLIDITWWHASGSTPVCT